MDEIVKGLWFHSNLPLQGLDNKIDQVFTANLAVDRRSVERVVL